MHAQEHQYRRRGDHGLLSQVCNICLFFLVLYAVGKSAIGALRNIFKVKGRWKRQKFENHITDSTLSRSGYFCDGGYFSCSSHASANFTVTVTDVEGPDQSLVLKTSEMNGMNAHSIRVRYATTDLYITTTISPGASATDDGTAVPSSASALPSATSTGSGSDGSQDASLSTGAKAGIGVGAAVGGLALLGFVLFLFRRRSQKQKPRTELEDTTYRPAPGPSPVVPQKSPGPSEMEGYKEPSELNAPTHTMYHEMEGNLHEADGGRHEIRV